MGLSSRNTLFEPMYPTYDDDEHVGNYDIARRRTTQEMILELHTQTLEALLKLEEMRYAVTMSPPPPIPTSSPYDFHPEVEAKEQDLVEEGRMRRAIHDELNLEKRYEVDAGVRCAKCFNLFGWAPGPDGNAKPFCPKGHAVPATDAEGTTVEPITDLFGHDDAEHDTQDSSS